LWALGAVAGALSVSADAGDDAPLPRRGTVWRWKKTTRPWTTPPFNPELAWVNRPWHSQYSLEASYQGSDVPGNPTSKTNYTNMVYHDAPAQSCRTSRVAMTPSQLKELRSFR
jgi:hypothetical protein